MNKSKTAIMIAFHGDDNIKAKYLSRVRMHRKMDQIVKGVYWQDGKGCAVGCTVHSGNHSSYEDELGIPRILARLEDGIFEKLPNDQAMEWPEAFLKAIPVGADLSMVWPKFALWLLIDPTDGLIRFAKSDRTKKSIMDIAALYERWIGGEKPSDEEWNKNRADAAAYAAAAAAAAAAAYAAADDAADAAAYAADGAAYAAAAAADAAADDAARKRQAKKLLQLLSEAPVK